MELNKIYNEDCLEGMKKMPDKSIDMILCDLPYGTTAIASHRLQRNFIGSELDYGYFKVAEQRYEVVKSQSTIFDFL